MNLLAQQVEGPTGDPFIELLFNETSGAIFIVLFVVLEILLIRRYLRRDRPADMDDD